MIRVLVVDDQALIRGGLAALIDSADDLEVVGEATNGAEAIQLAKATRADVILMDIRMPGMDGLAATRAISADDDLAGVRVLILTTFEIDDYVLRAIQAGASGFIGKGVEPAELLNAIRVVAAGESSLSPKATSALIAQFANATAAEPTADPSTSSTNSHLDLLTARERQIVSLVGMGMSNEEIAEHLHVSRLTAKTHANRAMMKLGARDRAQLVVIAFQSGLVRPGDVRRT
jgi:DNA-binding NarL/FixJ family response regulator